MGSPPLPLHMGCQTASHARLLPQLRRSEHLTLGALQPFVIFLGELVSSGG